MSGYVKKKEVLEAVRVESASVVVLAIPDDDATIRACRAIRTRAPDAFIAARASVLRKGLAIKEAGASVVPVDEIAAAESPTREVVTHIEQIASPAPASSEPDAINP